MNAPSSAPRPSFEPGPCSLCGGQGEEQNGDRCFLCEGTGMRPERLRCFACGGAGERRLGDPDMPVGLEDVEKFSNFVRCSGGFQITEGC
jgi:hypothetical protein